MKGQVLVDFLAAHPIPDDSPLPTDLSDEEIMWAPRKDGNVLRERFQKPNGARKEDAQDNVAGLGILFFSPDNALIPHFFSLTMSSSNYIA